MFSTICLTLYLTLGKLTKFLPIYLVFKLAKYVLISNSIPSENSFNTNVSVGKFVFCKSSQFSNSKSKKK